MNCEQILVSCKQMKKIKKSLESNYFDRLAETEEQLLQLSNKNQILRIVNKLMRIVNELLKENMLILILKQLN